MTQLEEYRAQLEKLRARQAAYKAQVPSVVGEERYQLRQKLAAYQTMIRELREQIDYLDPPAVRRRAAEQTRRLNVDAFTFDWFERAGIVWSDLEGRASTQAEAGAVKPDISKETAYGWLREAAQRLTRRQVAYLDAYYNRGLSMERIGAEHGVNKSVVSRCVHNGLDRMRAWVDAKRAIQECSDGAGGFDWERYLRQVQVFTERQKELLLLILSGAPRTLQELAGKLELNKSTVSRTVGRAQRRIREMGIPASHPTSRPRIRNWAGADKMSLAVQTGMSLGFCYRYCAGNQRVNGLTQYQYELARRMEAGVPAEETAAQLGLPVKTVRGNYQKLRQRGLRMEQSAWPEDSIGRLMDPETYARLRKLVDKAC